MNPSPRDTPGGGNVTESIWNTDAIVVPMADVQHIEKLTHVGKPNGLWLVTKHTRWDYERDIWNNPIYIPEPKAAAFLRDWCNYRHELEKDTLMEPPA